MCNNTKMDPENTKESCEIKGLEPNKLPKK